MWRIASSSEPTTLMLMIAARYSSRQSASVASTRRAPATASSSARPLASPRISIPSSRTPRRSPAGTRRDRRVHEQRLGGIAGLSFCVLALSTIASAIARSAAAST
jgi:hypothetical protein